MRKFYHICDYLEHIILSFSSLKWLSNENNILSKEGITQATCGFANEKRKKKIDMYSSPQDRSVVSS